MTQALDAAIRAANQCLCGEEQCRCDGAEIAPEAIRAALPAEPPAEVIGYLREEGFSEGEARAAWRLIRAHLLGEDA